MIYGYLGGLMSPYVCPVVSPYVCPERFCGDIDLSILILAAILMIFWWSFVNICVFFADITGMLTEWNEKIKVLISNSESRSDCKTRKLVIRHKWDFPSCPESFQTHAGRNNYVHCEPTGKKRIPQISSCFSTIMRLHSCSKETYKRMNCASYLKSSDASMGPDIKTCPQQDSSVYLWKWTRAGMLSEIQRGRISFLLHYCTTAQRRNQKGNTRGLFCLFNKQLILN